MCLQDRVMGILEHTAGTLGLVETWVLIIYGLGSFGPLSSFENVRISCILIIYDLGTFWAVILSDLCVENVKA